MTDEHRARVGTSDTASPSGRSAGGWPAWPMLGMLGMLMLATGCSRSAAQKSANEPPSAVEAVPSEETKPTIAPVREEAIGGPGPSGWRVRPSFKYDVLCLLNALTGDPYYLEYYKAEYDRLQPGFKADIEAALANLQRVIKTEGGGIVSAKLTLYFSVVEDSTLSQMIATLDDLEPMRRALQETPYYSEEGWREFLLIADDLKVVLNHLEDLNYERDWAERYLPTLEARSANLANELPKWSLLREVARLTGMPERSGPVEILVLQFNKPHGIRITGTRYLTYSGWPLQVVLNDAIHEMLHPPYNAEADSGLGLAINGLRESSFVMDKVENHNVSLGYNTLEGLIEEDVVQAFEQILAENAGIAENPGERWRASDEGIHVFAAALYHLLRRTGFDVGDETIVSLLGRELTSGALQPGNVRAMYEEFYAATDAPSSDSEE